MKPYYSNPGVLFLALMHMMAYTPSKCFTMTANVAAVAFRVATNSVHTSSRKWHKFMINHQDDETSESSTTMIVVFGRPGAGKTTVANEAAKILGDDCALALDLDVCVPQWMRDNFNQGIYPTLEQREAFAIDACEHVEEEIVASAAVGVIVSFSFVNTDLRDVFRQRFPHAKWALVDTTHEEAMRRIQQRDNHFYKGSPSEEVESASDEKSSEWNFAPVSFAHTVLPGVNAVDVNAKLVAKLFTQGRVERE